MVNFRLKSFYSILLISIFLIIIATSCSIQKRKYLPGYDFSYFHKKGNPKYSAKKEMSKNPIHETTVVKEKEYYYEKFNETTLATTSNKFVYTEKKLSIKNNSPSDTCDVIVLKKNAEEIRGKVIEITATSVKYSKCDDPNGKVLLIKKTDVFMVKYPNGTKEVMKDVKQEEKKREATSQNNKGNADFIEYGSSSGDGKKTNIFALLGLVLTFVALPVGFILSIVGLVQIKKNPEKYSGKGLAIAGIVIGLLVALIIIIALVVVA